MTKLVHLYFINYQKPLLGTPIPLCAPASQFLNGQLGPAAPCSPSQQLGWAELCRRERQGPNGSRRFVPEHTWELERAHTTRGNARQPAQVGQQPAELQARTEYGIQRCGRPSWPIGQTAVHETSSAPACQDIF